MDFTKTVLLSQLKAKFRAHHPHAVGEEIGTVRLRRTEHGNYPGQCRVSASTHVHGLGGEPNGVVANHGARPRIKHAQPSESEAGHLTAMDLSPRGSGHGKYWCVTSAFQVGHTIDKHCTIKGRCIGQRSPALDMYTRTDRYGVHIHERQLH